MQLCQVDAPYNHISRSFNTVELNSILSIYNSTMVQHGTQTLSCIIN